MSLLKRLSRLEMSTHVKDCVVLESHAFIDAGIQKCCFHFGNFSREFNRGVMVVYLFDELFYFVSVDSPEREKRQTERSKLSNVTKCGNLFC